ncbi:MAG: creatininase family protein [Planctomycetota bacterium]
MPLVLLPLAPLEWHGPHLTMGVDPINAEQTALAVADEVGGVVHPTVYMGTERERPPEILESLGYSKDDYVVGMDHPEAKGLVRSYYHSEEIFALTLKSHIDQFISHGYKYIFIINGHGAVNHNEVLRRLCIEYSNGKNDCKVAYSISMPDAEIRKGLLAHAGMEETSLMMYFDPAYVNLDALPAADVPLKYKDYSIVDGGGFTGNPGKDFAVPAELDPRSNSSAEAGEKLFAAIVNDLSGKVREVFKI